MVTQPDNPPEPPEPSDDERDDELDAASGGDHAFDALTRKQERALLALLREPTIAKAAGVCDTSERTMHRWLNDELFSRVYRKARREAFGQAIGLTQHYAPLAVNTLATLMADKSTPAHARVTAATTLLKFGREGIELDDLAARVEALEEAARVATSGAGAVGGRNGWR
jgi:hypothetical protein